MTDPPAKAIEFSQVFADELAYLRGRWRNAYADPAQREAEGPSDHPLPSSERELVGLALSGGGLGSSTFQLGVVEALDRTGVFDHVDYLSTASSGGFVGVTISAAMRGGGEFPFREAAGGRGSPHLSWLRSGLADTWRRGLVSWTGSFGVLVRNNLINFLVLLPLVLAFAVGMVWKHGPLLATWEAAEEGAAIAQATAATLRKEADWAEKRAMAGDRPEDWAAAVQAKQDADLAAEAAVKARTAWKRKGRAQGGIFRVTPWIAGIFLLLVVIFPVMTRVYKILGGDAEAGSSGRSRGLVEKGFGILIALMLGTALAEMWPLWMRSYHQLGAHLGYGTRGFLALLVAGGTLTVFVAAGKVLPRLRGPRQKISLLLVGLLGPVIPALVAFEVAESLVYPVAGIASAGGTETATKEATAVSTPTPAYLVEGTALEPMEFGDPPGGSGILLLILCGGAAAAAVAKLPRSKLRTVLIPLASVIGLVVGYPIAVWLAQALFFLGDMLGADGRLDLIWLFGAWTTFLFCWAAVDVNLTSSLGLYRDRLAELFLTGVREGTDGKAPEPFVEPEFGPSELCGGAEGISKAPYHLLNAAVNLQGSRDRAQRLGHAPFIFSKRYTGGERTGYCRTEQLERVFPQMDLQTVMAVSAAAVSPNAGRVTHRALVALMTLVNVRLGYWLPNPGRLAKARDRPAKSSIREQFRWRVTLIELAHELLGAVDARHRLVNLSDGGNVDDTGAYELLRRRCKYVIVVDGAADPEHSFGSLIRLRRRAQLDLGVDIELSLDGLRPDRDQLTRRHAAAGRIFYPPAEEGGEPETGLLLYIRPSLTGDEDDLITERRAYSADFPHQSDAAEGLDEQQFSAYRALGLHSLAGLFEESVGDRGASRLDFRQFQGWFQGLDERLTPKGIFISYRRADASGHALLIHKTLERRFPNAEIFLDIGGIEPGEEFTSAIEETLDRARITLVLIGNQWLDLRGADGARRLDDPDDTVRSEISISLAKGKRVIPLLVEQTPMPREEELPDELRPLAYQNAVNLTHDRFDSDLETLVRILGAFLD